MSAIIIKIRSRVPPEPIREELQLTLVLQALSDPVRMKIVQKLALERKGIACKACACPSIPKSTLAHHFKVLRQAGLIRSREVGTQLQNELREDDLDARFPGLLAVVVQSMTNS